MISLLLVAIVIVDNFKITLSKWYNSLRTLTRKESHMADPEESSYEQIAEQLEFDFTDSLPELTEKLRQLDEEKHRRYLDFEERLRQGRHFLETLDSQSD